MYFVVLHNLGESGMFDLYENIKSLCEERNVTVSKMCLDIGASKSLMSNIKNHRAESISGKTAKKIAEYLDVSVDRVLHGTDATMQLEEDEAAEYLQAVHDRPQLKVLFKRGKNATPEKLDAILALLGGNDDED